MASYQDFETRISVLESKIDFIMKFLKVPIVTSALDPRPVPYSLWDVYLASKGAGLTPRVTSDEVKDTENG